VANRSNNRKEDRELENAYKKISGSTRNTSKMSADKKRGASIVTLCICIAIVISLLIFGYLYMFSGVTPGKILDNVSVAGIDVGGMTKSEAATALQNAIGNSYSEETMVVTLLDNSVQLTPELTGVKLDIDAAVDVAYSYGRTGSTTQRNQDQLKALSDGIAADITKCISLNTASVKAALSKLITDTSSTLTQTTYTIKGERPKLTFDPNADQSATNANQTLVIAKGKCECVIVTDALMTQVINAYSLNVFEMEAACQIKEPDVLDLDSIFKEYCVAPIDAVLDADTNEVIPHSDGWQFDLENAKKLLAEAKYGETIEIPFALVTPEVTYDDINADLFGVVLSSYTAKAEYDANRNVNLALACASINGIVLQPGEIFDYNTTLGERTPDRGYLPGASYAGEDTVYTYGGGICQVSSTLYSCVLLADLEVITRVEHGFASSYVPLGMDATVSWGGPEFRFRNNTDMPIKIEAVANGASVEVKLLGATERDYYVEMENEVLDVFDWETEYVEMTSDNENGYKDGDVLVTPYTGYIVKTYRCKYDRQTDELIEKVYEDRSVYGSRNRKVCKIVDQEPEVPETTVAPETTAPTETTVPEFMPGVPGSGDISGGIEEG